MSSFVIDALPERALHYRDDHAIVAVDAFRATTTIVTALAANHRVYPVPSLADALERLSLLPDAVLAGEIAGEQPDSFEMNNSPAAVAALTDRRPLVLLSSSGTVLLKNAQGRTPPYVACFRNLSATASHITGSRHDRVALIGAGTRGQSRPEDEMACAWIGAQLMAAGWEPENASTAAEVERWRDANISSLRTSPSAAYLRATAQEADIDFVVSHVDDLEVVAVFDGDEVSLLTTRLAERNGG